MDFENKIPEWKNEGTEPSEEMRTKGFEARYKPPAAYFNWFWNKVTKCIAELQLVVNGIYTLFQTHLTEFKNHSSSTNNPHGVTKEQVGLGNVTNDRQASYADLKLHVNNKGNPHEVTAEQIGASKTSKVINATLLASEWRNGIYQWNNANITKEEQIIELTPTEGISQTQLEALQSANIVGSDQNVGSVQFKVYGEIPTIDIPVTFIIRGDV